MTSLFSLKEGTPTTAYQIILRENSLSADKNGPDLLSPKDLTDCQKLA